MIVSLTETSSSFSSLYIYTLIIYPLTYISLSRPGGVPQPVAPTGPPSGINGMPPPPTGMVGGPPTGMGGVPGPPGTQQGMPG